MKLLMSVLKFKMPFVNFTGACLPRYSSEIKLKYSGRREQLAYCIRAVHYNRFGENSTFKNTHLLLLCVFKHFKL